MASLYHKKKDYGENTVIFLISFRISILYVNNAFQIGDTYEKNQLNIAVNGK